MNATAEGLAPAAIDQVVTREAAPAALEQLRNERANGRVSEGDYFKRADYLRAVMSADPTTAPPAPPKAFETPEEQLERSYAEHMAPPPPERYDLPQATIFAGDDATAFDVGVRNVFHAGGIPNHLAGPILEGVIRSFDTLAYADDGARETALQASNSKLREMWGSEFDARMGRVNDLIADMLEGDDRVGELFDRAPWLLHSSVAAMDYLDRVAAHRARRNDNTGVAK